MRVKVSEGKTKDVAIIDVTPDNYIVPDNEKHLYHCVIEIKKFDSETGKRLSIPDRKSTRLNSSHVRTSRMPSSA